MLIYNLRRLLMTVPLLLGLALAPPAAGNQTQASLIQDDPHLFPDPAGTLSTARQLGANVIRVTVTWADYAPAASSRKMPGGFNGANPAAYKASAWAPLDTVVRDATQDGITPDLNPGAPSPLWATGPGMPHGSGYPFLQWRPNAVQFGKFMKALGIRYSGHYTPPGQSSPLPRVNFWSIWNEPDFGPHLAPQGLPGHPGVPASPAAYRGIVNQAWLGLHVSGHGGDTILIGELAPRSEATAPTAFGNFNGMTPIFFLQNLYCVDSHYRPLRGKVAAIRGCPTNAAGSAHFAAANPALFQATAYADHPYMYGFPPNKELNSPPLKYFKAEVGQYTTLATIGNLERGLNRLVAAYHQHKVFPIWNTEYGIITNPPHNTFINGAIGMSWPMAAEYDNWAEYISWKDPRLASFAQYEIQDSQPPSDNAGGFASGLITYGGQKKDGYDAWRMPLYLPQTTSYSAFSPLEVWGDVRPMRFAELDDPYAPETVQLMFRPVGETAWQVLTQFSPGADGYFDQKVLFPASGTIRLQWTYPAGTLGGVAGQTIDSRSVQVTLK